MPTGRIVKVPPHLVAPPHGIRDFERLRRIHTSLCSKGWHGRPLLGYPVRRGGALAIVTLTGTHRLGAAQLARLPAVPVEPIQVHRYPREWRFAIDGVYIAGLKVDDQQVLWQAFKA